ncbi:prolyl-tRNA synthetase [Methanococcus voltae]|nr:prolyl-tRNA synthetase [Methanococcus voltae]
MSKETQKVKKQDKDISLNDMDSLEFSEWYGEILETAKIYDLRYPIKGCGVYLPYGFKIRRYSFEILRDLLDSTNHDETLFPMLIPETLLAKEGEHIKGFEDEVFWVTHGGKNELDVRLALRPTSETAIYHMMKQWLKVHTDLPFKLYQTVNTFRYETKHTRPLIRLREIMTFNEAHTAHSTKEECEAQVKEGMYVYSSFFESLAIPVLISKRPEWDKFPGAEYTTAYDTIYPDGKTMQIGTVHNLGQHFAKTFDLEFETAEGEKDYVYQSCYGISDRVIASIIAIHGDKNGLVIPPKVAPIQIAMVPLLFKGKEEIVLEKANELYDKLKKFARIELDTRDIRPGRKFNDWELKGVPLRIELGPRDLENDKVMIFRRDTNEKFDVAIADLTAEYLVDLMETVTSDMAKKAYDAFLGHIEILNIEGIDNESLVETIKEALNNRKVVLIPFDEKLYNEEFEEQIGASILGECEFEGTKYISIAKTY